MPAWLDVPVAWFGAPLAALALPGVAAVAWVLAAGERRRARRLAAVVGRRAPALAAEQAPLRARRRNRLAVAGIALGVVAWMQPRFGEGEAAAAPPGADLCVCLDVSRSMLAADVPPSRLRSAQEAIADLGRRTRGDRLALVVFAGQALLRVPLTRDVESMVAIARTADPSEVALGGTDLGAAIDAAVAALAAAQHRDAAGGAADAPLEGAVLLVTDGEDPGGAGRAAAGRARGRGLAVHCVGVGSALGSKITMPGPGGREVFLRDREGREVVTRHDAASLRSIAAAGGGRYVDAAGSAQPLVEVYERGVVPELAGRARARGPAGAALANRFQLPLAIGLALLLLDLLLPRRRRRTAAAPHGGTA